MKSDIKPQRTVALIDGVHAPLVRSADPLYIQVSRALKDEIVNGSYPVGSQLPTEEDLCARFSVSRYTVREALRRLREEGLVSSRQGAGTVVVPPPPADSYVLPAMSISDLVAFGISMRFAIESIKMVILDGKQAERIGVSPGDEWLAVRGFRHTEDNDLPLCWTEYYINREFAGVGRLLPRHNGAIFPLIEDLFAQTVVAVEQEITAELITPALSIALKVKQGTAALAVRRTYKTADGQIAQVTINTHPASRFKHSSTMRRMKG